MPRLFMLAAWVVASFAVAAAPAKAVPTTYHIEFTASAFDSPGKTQVPVDPVAGFFTVTFDPATSDFISGDVTSYAININVTGSVVFTYSASNGGFVASGELSGTGLGANTNDFWVRIADFLTSPTLLGVTYVQEGTLDVFTNTQGSVTVTATELPSETPLPAALPLFAGGLGVVTLLARRKPRKQAV